MQQQQQQQTVPAKASSPMVSLRVVLQCVYLRGSIRKCRPMSGAGVSTSWLMLAMSVVIMTSAVPISAGLISLLPARQRGMPLITPRQGRDDPNGTMGGVPSVYFLPLPPDAVILLVAIKSPMYFWRNLLLLSSLSCSSLTASIRLRMVNRESWSCLACLCRC